MKAWIMGRMSMRLPSLAARARRSHSALALLLMVGAKDARLHMTSKGLGDAPSVLDAAHAHACRAECRRRMLIPVACSPMGSSDSTMS